MERQRKDDRPGSERSAHRIGEWGQAGDAFGFTPRKDFASAADLLAHPAASFMAMSAVGFGLASHAFGLWVGAVTGAAQASQHLLRAQPPAAKDRPLAGERPAAEVVTLPARKPALKVVAKAEAPAGPARDTAPAAVQVEASPADQASEAFRKPRAIARPAVADDLKAIAGIGPKLEKVLNDLGIWTYAQIAAWEKPEIGWVDDFLSFGGRIDRDGWLAQAARLAKGTD